jgi:hypothetical protein
VRLGGYITSEAVQDIEVIGSRAYVSSYAGKLFIVDVSDWQHPQLLSTYATGGSSWDVRVMGSRAYVADGVGGLLILNVSNPSAPTKLGAYATWSDQSQTIVGNRAYIAGSATGLQIVDMSNLSNPVRLGAVATTGLTAEVQVSGNLGIHRQARHLEWLGLRWRRAADCEHRYACRASAGRQLCG